MPEMSGTEATRHLREDSRYSAVPIVGVTGTCDPECTRSCLESGMDAVLGKPLDTSAMFRVLQRLLGAAAHPPPAAAVTTLPGFTGQEW